MTSEAVKAELEKEQMDHKAVKDELDQLQLEFQNLEEQIEDLQKYKENSIKYRLTRIHELNDEEFHKLKNDINEGLETVQCEEDDRSKCAICKDNKKEIYFVDGCNHVVICGNCEQGMESKVCPRCDQPYTNAVRLDI